VQSTNGGHDEQQDTRTRIERDALLRDVKDFVHFPHAARTSKQHKTRTAQKSQKHLNKTRLHFTPQQNPTESNPDRKDDFRKRGAVSPRGRSPAARPSVACRGGERPASSETGAASAPAPAPSVAGRRGRGKGSASASPVASPGAPLDSSIATEREWWGEKEGFVALLVYHQRVQWRVCIEAESSRWLLAKSQVAREAVFG